MPPPLPNPRTALWCCAVCLSQSARASRLPAHVPLSPGYGPARGCAASRSSISALCAAFFWLPGVAHGRLIALKARVLIQDGAAGITEGPLIGNLLFVYFSPVRLTPIADPLVLGMPYPPILFAFGFFFAAVFVGPLFFLCP